MGSVPRRLLLGLATLVVVLGLVATYVRSELATPEAFADRGVAALQSDPVRSIIAEEVAVDLLERRSPDLVAARPLVLTAVEAVLETESFERVLRRAAITAHGILLRGDDDAAVELRELRGVLVPALRVASPGLAREVPDDLRPQIAEFRSSDAATFTVRAANGVSGAALPLLVLGLAGLVALVVTAADRRRAAASVGVATTVAALLAVLALAALEAEVVSHAGPVGVISQDEARAAARATWDALAGDLRRLLVALGVLGALLWTSAALAAARLDREAAATRAVHVLTGGSLPTPGRVLRGLGVAVLGGLVLLRVDPLFEIVAVLVGGAFVVLGLTEAVSTLRGAREGRARPERPRRRGPIAGGVAVVAALVVAAVLLTGVLSGTPAPLKDEELTACNGLPRLCDRRLDQVVLPATHNSMSAADRPGWLFANQARPIPRQLEDGIRLLMVDPHYGIVNREGRIRTDLTAEGTTRNRVAGELGSDAVGAAERLAGRLGLVPDEGRRRVYLCHTLCELGAEGMGRTLREIRGWLERNRAEVLVLLLESSVAPDDVVQAFEDADLEPYLATLPRGRPLPTLRSMITSGRRLVVLDEGDGGGAPWFQPGFVFAQNTSISGFTKDQATCEPNRGTPESPLLIANHWVDRFPPPAAAAARANRASVIERRVSRCRDRLGRTPNAIAVDFYDRGDLLETVARLNREG